MDDCVAAVTATVAACRRCKQRIKYQSVGTRSRGCSTWKMQSCNRVPRTHLCSLCNVCHTAVVLGTYYMLLEAACTDSYVCMTRCSPRAAFVWSSKSETMEDHVLYHATVVRRCTSKAIMSLPAAVLRYVSWVTALNIISNIQQTVYSLDRPSSRVQRADAEIPRL